MTNPSQYPIEAKIRATVRSVEPSPEFSQKVWKQITGSPQPKPAPKFFTRLAWTSALVVLGVALILIVVAPQSVVAAFRGLIAYLPGIGFVQDNPGTLYLSKPFSIVQDGVTLTVEQAVADTEKTVIAYRVDGLPQPQMGVACIYDDNRLLFPDGRARLPIGGGVSDNQARVEFQPLPPGVFQATLLVSMSEGPDPHCSAPQKWSVDISLGSTPPDEKLMPVFEGQDIQQPQVTEASGASNTVPEGVNNSDLSFMVDRVADLADGYLVVGHVVSQDKNWNNVMIMSDSIQAIASDGHIVPLQLSGEDLHDNEFAFKTVGKIFTTPLTIKIGKITVQGNSSAAPSFSFDAGPVPQIGQSWTVEQKLTVLDHEIFVRNVRAVHDDRNQKDKALANGYEVEFETTPDLEWLDLQCSGEPKDGASWGGGMRNAGDSGKIIEMIYSSGFPTGKVTCQIPAIRFRLSGSWQFEWQLLNK